MSDFAWWARLAIDVWAVFMAHMILLGSVFWAGGIPHSTPSRGRALGVIAQAIAIAAWFVFRPVF